MKGSGNATSTAHYGANLEVTAIHSVDHFAIMRAGEAAVRAWLMHGDYDDDQWLFGAVAGGRGDAADLWQAGGGVSLCESLSIDDRLVAECWNAIERVAAALLRRGWLDGDELAILAGAEPHAREPQGRRPCGSCWRADSCVPAGPGLVR
ncbi:hypothetical protein [Actinoplanes sp. NPDC051494]|uniref:hypothetical protein n=1 Tax=Actinoplanes sp. NPDC051494 TaxID=3363907 RepID=UPI0037B0628B